MKDYTYVTADIVSTLNIGLYLKSKDVKFIKAYNEKILTSDAEDERYDKIVDRIEKQVGMPFGFKSNKNDKRIISGIYEKNGNTLFGW